MTKTHRQACDLVDAALEDIGEAHAASGLVASKLRDAARKLNKAAKTLESST